VTIQLFGLGHTKYNGVQPAKPLYGSHRLDLGMIRLPGLENGAFVVTPDSRFCSFSLPPHKPTPNPNRLTVLSCRRLKHMTILRMVIIDIIVIIVIIFVFV
jgi:hypothetical protein